MFMFLVKERPVANTVETLFQYIERKDFLRFRYTLTKVSLRYTLYTLQGSGSDIHLQRFLSGIHFILYRVQVQIYTHKGFSQVYTI